MSLCSFVDELYKSNTVELQLSQMRALVFYHEISIQKSKRKCLGTKIRFKLELQASLSDYNKKQAE